MTDSPHIIDRFETVAAAKRAVIPALRRYVFLNHGLVWLNSPYQNGPLIPPNVDAACKWHIEAEQRAKELIAANDLFGYVFLHARPFRIDALYGAQRLLGSRMDNAVYWGVVRDAWIDQKSPYNDLNLWIALFSSDRPGKEHLMNSEERRRFAELPETIPVYRGTAGPFKFSTALSWTLCEDMAKWFAYRADKDDAWLAKGTVHKRLIVAYFSPEAEILVLPGGVEATASRLPSISWEHYLTMPNSPRVL